MILKIIEAYKNFRRNLYWWNVKRTCKHPIKIETFINYPDRYVVEQCSTCNKEFYFDL